MNVFSRQGFYQHAIGLAALVIHLNAIVGLILRLAICRSVAYYQKQMDSRFHCVYRWTNIPNLATEMEMLVFPLLVPWRLHTGFGDKFGPTLTFLIRSAGFKRLGLG